MIYKCICGKEFDSKGAFNGHKSKCKIYQGELSKILDKHLTPEFLEWWYISKNRSTNELAKIINKRYNPIFRINIQKIINRCNKFGIKTWTIKEGNNLPNVKKIRHERNNLAKGTPGYKKRQENLAKEGITNVFQRESVKKKIRNTMIKKYGVPNPVYLDFPHNNGLESKPHIKIIKFLESKGYIQNEDFISEDRYTLKAFNNELNRDFCPRPDIIFPSKKLVIEIYGDRWHANPNIYDDDEIIHTWYGDQTANQIHERDLIRENHIKSLGYDLIILWESDINKNNFDKLIEYGI